MRISLAEGVGYRIGACLLIEDILWVVDAII